LFTNAAQIGQLDGVPAVVRDRANRSILANLEGRLRADEIRLLGRADLSEAEKKQLADIQAKLDGLLAIRSRLTDGTKPQAFVLGLDTNGNGRAIIASGNPDTAVNVATYVPGTGANLGSVSGLMDRSDRMYNSAIRKGSPSTAVITWVGYDAPQDLLQAAGEADADKAKKDLDRFQDGLRATHQGVPSHNTAIGHSYGSTVVGHAARDGVLNVDDVVFVGSPGVGVDHARDLNMPPEHVHATVADHDMIKLTNAHGMGPDPLGPSPATADFGGDVFTSKPGTEGPWQHLGYSFAAHSEYWDENNDSLANLGLVIAGKPTY